MKVGIVGLPSLISGIPFSMMYVDISAWSVERSVTLSLHSQDRSTISSFMYILSSLDLVFGSSCDPVQKDHWGLFRFVCLHPSTKRNSDFSLSSAWIVCLGSFFGGSLSDEYSVTLKSPIIM